MFPTEEKTSLLLLKRQQSGTGSYFKEQ